MKIAVVDLVSIDGGGYHITESLYNYIREGRCKKYEWIFIVSEQNFTSNQYVTIVHVNRKSKGYYERAKTELLIVNKIIEREHVQLVIAMSNMCVLGCRVNQLVYLQQSIPFQKEKIFSFFRPEERKYAFRQFVQGGIIKHSLRKAKGVLVQTKWMEEAVREKVKNSPIIQIGYPEDNIANKEIDRTKRIQPHFFYPCGPELYKNLKIVVGAVKKLIRKGYNFNFYLTINKDELENLIGEKVDNHTFIFLGKITHEEVQDMYTKTTLVFASYIETVGLPLVEAKKAGTWIIASDCAFSHEVLNSYSNKSFFDYKSEDSLLEQMEKILQHKVSFQETEYINDNKACCWDMLTDYIDKITI